MALRLRYEIDTPRRLREHVHVVDGAGYFFFPGVVAPKGTLASLEVSFSACDEVALFRGWVWARPSGGGIWLELSGAGRALDKLPARLERSEVRLGTDQLVLVEATGRAGLLCRLRDVSAGGTRLGALPADAGTPGGGVRVALPEAGAYGEQLEAYGHVVWAFEGEVGVRWNTGDLASRAAVRRLLQGAIEEWETARCAVHPRSCRCMRGSAYPDVLLLG